MLEIDRKSMLEIVRMKSVEIVRQKEESTNRLGWCKIQKFRNENQILIFYPNLNLTNLQMELVSNNHETVT